MIEKYIKIRNNFIKMNNREINPNLKNSNSKYKKDQNGEFILNANLSTNKCSDRRNRNYLRIIDIASEWKYKPIKVTKTGFCIADLTYKSTKEANELLDTYDASLNQQFDVCKFDNTI